MSGQIVNLMCGIVLLGMVTGAHAQSDAVGSQVEFPSVAKMNAVRPSASVPLGLPAIMYPKDNPQTPEKIALGELLFNDKRFSTTKEVSCSTCHLPEKAFTDNPIKVSEGINKLT